MKSERSEKVYQMKHNIKIKIPKSNVEVSFKPALPLNSTRITRIAQILTDFLSVFIRVISVIRVIGV